MIDLRNKGLTGKVAEKVLDSVLVLLPIKMRYHLILKVHLLRLVYDLEHQQQQHVALKKLSLKKLLILFNLVLGNIEDELRLKKHVVWLRHFALNFHYILLL